MKLSTELRCIAAEMLDKDKTIVGAADSLDMRGAYHKSLSLGASDWPFIYDTSVHGEDRAMHLLFLAAAVDAGALS